jgi:hypothetical protein
MSLEHLLVDQIASRLDVPGAASFVEFTCPLNLQCEEKPEPPGTPRIPASARRWHILHCR